MADDRRHNDHNTDLRHGRLDASMAHEGIRNPTTSTHPKPTRSQRNRQPAPLSLPPRRPLPHPIHKHIHLLVIKTQAALDSGTLVRREGIVPNRILDQPPARLEVVVLGAALVRAEGGGVALGQQAPVPDGRGGQVVARAQQGLVEEQVAGALCDDDAA